MYLFICISLFYSVCFLFIGMHKDKKNSMHLQPPYTVLFIISGVTSLWGYLFICLFISLLLLNDYFWGCFVVIVDVLAWVIMLIILIMNVQMDMYSASLYWIHGTFSTFFVPGSMAACVSDV